MNYPLYTFLTVLALCGTMLLMLPKENFGAAVNISATGTSTLPSGLNLTTGCLTYAGGDCVTSASRLVYITATDLNPSNNSYATSTGLVIPSGFLTASSTIEFKYAASACVSTGSGNGTVYLRTASGATIASAGFSSDGSGSTGYAGAGWITIGSNNGSFANEIYSGAALTGDSSPSFGFGTIEGTASVDLTGGATLYVVAGNSSCDSTNPKITSFSLVINK